MNEKPDECLQSSEEARRNRGVGGANAFYFFEAWTETALHLQPILKVAKPS